MRHPEAKSLAPDGTACVWNTVGLLKRPSIFAKGVVPIGKETDRHWEQGDDPSQINFKVKEFRKKKKMLVAEASERKLWREAGLRCGTRKSGLSPNTVSAILNGVPVKVSTLKIFAVAMRG